MADAPQTDPLAALIDIPLPAPVSLWPQTWEARLAIAVLLVALVAGAWWAIHRWRANRYRREALAQLREIEAAGASSQSSDLSAALAALVRRTALAAFPRQKIAALAGPPWLAFLDTSYGGRGFSSGPGQTLEIAAYQPSPPTQQRALIDLVRQWIKAHHD